MLILNKFLFLQISDIVFAVQRKGSEHVYKMHSALDSPAQYRLLEVRQ